MPKQRLKLWLPKPEDIKKNRALRYFAPYFANPHLWHLARRPLNRGVYIGMVCAFFPLPGQMPLAVVLCLLFRGNIPMALALTWLTNPITTIPVFYGVYVVGAKILGEPVVGIRTIGRILADSARWILADGTNPFILHQGTFSFTAFALGLLVCTIFCTLLAGWLFQVLWRYYTAKLYKKSR